MKIFTSLTLGLLWNILQKNKGARINVIAKYVYPKHSLLLLI